MSKPQPKWMLRWLHAAVGFVHQATVHIFGIWPRTKGPQVFEWSFRVHGDVQDEEDAVEFRRVIQAIAGLKHNAARGRAEALPRNS
jgi:hypothetical protein